MPTLQVDAATMRRDAIRRLFENKDTFGSSLIAILADNYNLDFMSWEPISIKRQVKDDFNANLLPVNQDKIWSLILVLTTNQFQLSMEIFSQVCAALSGQKVDFSLFTPLEPEQLVWGVAEALLLDPPDPVAGTTEFSHEISRYTGLMLAEGGVWKPPKVLEFAEYPVANPTLALETNFAEDPDLFYAAVKNQQRITEHLELFVKATMRRLFLQMNALPLLNRKTLFKLKQPNQSV